MRHNLTLLALLAVVLVVPMAAYAGSAAGTGIQGTGHDFVRADHASEFGIPTGFLNPSKDNETRDYTAGQPGAVGLCAFCHTPHRAIQTSLLWNHSLSSATYTWSDADQTVGGTALPANIAIWAGPSKLCLSCHDGSVALGDLAWYQGAVKTGGYSTGTSMRYRTVSGGVGGTVEDQHKWPDKYNVGATGGVLGDMKGNHPVAIPYPFGGVANSYNGATTGAGVVLGTEFAFNPTTSGIRLYRMSGAGKVVVAIPTTYSGTDVGIECGSCHDVHNGPTVKEDLITNRTRLVRGTVYGDGPGGAGFAVGTDDYLCVKCHKK